MSRISKRKEGVSHLRIEADHSNRRLDNFLLAHWKDVPKSRIYQMIRKGEVRVDGGRVGPDHRLRTGERIRLPPVERSQPVRPPAPPPESIQRVMDGLLYEDTDLMVLNKPSGIPVHAGTGRSFGVIDILRRAHSTGLALQLVHRLDQETSGCLLVAKNHACLRRLHQLLRQGLVEKQYVALLRGNLPSRSLAVNFPLERSAQRGRERLVAASDRGKPAQTRFTRIRDFRTASLVSVTTATGRTHQIRVHSNLIGHPVAGDHRYGDREFNKALRALGLRRLFLHASRIRVPGASHGGGLSIHAPLPEDLDRFLSTYA